MSITGIENIRTMADVRAEREQPVGGGDLDRNAFLRLFTTQLQNQNPLDPMKNEQFVAQLAQFSTLEATYSMSDSLGKFVESQQTERMLRSSSLLGKQVFAPQVEMQQRGGDRLDGVVQVDQVFDRLQLYVVDAATGQIVNQIDMGPQIPGELPFTWNGGTFEGDQAPEGVYRFQAVGTTGDLTSEVPVLSATRIKSVAWDAGLEEIFVEIEDGRTIALSEISQISE